MRKLAYLAVVTATIVAAPAYADGGYLGVAYSQADRSFGSTASDVDVVAVSGAAMLGEHVQVDGIYVNIEGGDSDHTGLSAHLFDRNDRFL